MFYQHLHELPSADVRAVIINVNTRWVTTLALMSALRNVALPTVVLDCQSTDGSLAHFQDLMRRHPFDLLSVPLQSHGTALDTIFAQIPARQVLLIDSDVEVRAARTPQRMLQALASDEVFGAGFVHQGGWMTSHKQPYGWYVERMWIPFTLLSVAHVRDALAHGQSFLAQTVINEFLPSQTLARLLIKRFRIPGLRRVRLAPLDRFRGQYFGQRPAFVAFDTGATLYQHLRYARGYRFEALPWQMNDEDLTHFHGVTRLLLNRRDRHGAGLADISAAVAQRLRDVYALDVPAGAG